MAQWITCVWFLLSSFQALAVQEKFSYSRPLMGTRFAITCVASNRETADQGAELAFAQAEAVNRVASDYLPESELSQLSRQPVGVPIILSELLFDLLEKARAIAKETQGAYDPTMGPLTRMWRESRQAKRLPSAQQIEAARKSVGWQHFTLEANTRSITLHRKGMVFDLGGIAKGYAADRMLATMRERGIVSAMIAAGGDIRLGAPPPGRDGWRVAVQTFDQKKADEVLTLHDAAVSTSGDLYQMIEIDGIRYSHIVDPATGLGLTKRVAAVVIADRAELSDPLATAACILSEKGAQQLRRKEGVRDVKIRIWQDGQSTSPAQPH